MYPTYNPAFRSPEEDSSLAPTAALNQPRIKVHIETTKRSQLPDDHFDDDKHLVKRQAYPARFVYPYRRIDYPVSMDTYNQQMMLSPRQNIRTQYADPYSQMYLTRSPSEDDSSKQRVHVFVRAEKKNKIASAEEKPVRNARRIRSISKDKLTELRYKRQGAPGYGYEGLENTFPSDYAGSNYQNTNGRESDEDKPEVHVHIDAEKKNSISRVENEPYSFHGKNHKRQLFGIAPLISAFQPVRSSLHILEDTTTTAKTKSDVPVGGSKKEEPQKQTRSTLEVPVRAESFQGVVHSRSTSSSHSNVEMRRKSTIERLQKRQILFTGPPIMTRATVNGRKHRNPIAQLIKMVAGPQAKNILGLNSKSFDVFPGPLPKGEESPKIDFKNRPLNGGSRTLGIPRQRLLNARAPAFLPPPQMMFNRPVAMPKPFGIERQFQRPIEAGNSPLDLMLAKVAKNKGLIPAIANLRQQQFATGLVRNPFLMQQPISTVTGTRKNFPFNLQRTAFQVPRQDPPQFLPERMRPMFQDPPENMPLRDDGDDQEPRRVEEDPPQEAPDLPPPYEPAYPEPDDAPYEAVQPVERSYEGMESQAPIADRDPDDQPPENAFPFQLERSDNNPYAPEALQEPEDRTPDLRTLEPAPEDVDRDRDREREMAPPPSAEAGGQGSLYPDDDEEKPEVHVHIQTEKSRIPFGDNLKHPSGRNVTQLVKAGKL